MFRFLKNLNLNAKFFTFATLVLVFVFGGLAVWIYSNERQSAIEQADSRMYSQLEDISTLLDIEYKSKQIEVSQALKVMAQYLKLKGELSEKEERIQFVVVNPDNQTKQVTNLKKWTLGGTQIQENIKLIDSIQQLVGMEATIFQKSTEGYLRITSTEIELKNNKRLLGYYLPNSSQIVQTIERGQTYRSRIKKDGEYYLVAFEPLKIEGEVRGMIYTGAKEKNISGLRKKLKEKKYYLSGFPFAMSAEGEYVIHPILEGKIADEAFLDYAKKNKRGKFRFKYPNTQEGTWKWTYFTYYEPYELFVGATLDEAQLLDRTLERVQSTLFFGFLSALIVYLIGIGFTVSYITRAIKGIVRRLSLMAQGKSIDKMATDSTDEIGLMAQSLNKLIDGLESYKDFAQNIGKGNLSASFQPLSPEDELGASLLEMRHSLQDAESKEEKEKWMSEGFTEFSNILRNNNDNIQLLCLDIITNVVKKLNGKIGSLFLLKNNQLQEKAIKDASLELIACYAYDRQRILKKEVRVGEGLLGQAFQEGDTLNIREIPENYIQITSGLGEANPNNILIVPLKTNEHTLGVIEVASLELFDDKSVEFLEKLSESIAITLFTVSNNLRTEQLFRESQYLTLQMREKEEEMRQNIEEMQATQEKMANSEKELKRVLFDAKNQKELMDALINNTEDMIVALDKDYKITIYNEIAKAWYLEQTYQKLTIGINFLGVLPLEQRESFKENYSRALLGERFEVEEAYMGTMYEYRYNPIQDEQGKAAGVSIFIRDITQRKTLEQANQNLINDLRANEEKIKQNLKAIEETQDEVKRKLFALEQYDKAINESNIAKVEFSLDGFVMGTNQAFANILQYEANELVGKQHKDFVDEETAKSPEYLNFWRNLRVGIPQVGEQKRIDKYGQEIWLWAAYSPVRNKDGKVLSIVKLATDVTTYKLKEESLQIRLEKLQKEIEKLKEKE
ncbi:MAG: Cache 3/Cache 2 fusion domain-containing protein [Thermonemataceae bacterium]|nr:Cache 3/Cache 2 fusion domain-containing protein [Thermonemataceae bacterium]